MPTTGPSDGHAEVIFECICHPHELTTASPDGTPVSAIGPSDGRSAEVDMPSSRVLTHRFHQMAHLCRPQVHQGMVLWRPTCHRSELTHRFIPLAEWYIWWQPQVVLEVPSDGPTCLPQVHQMVLRRFFFRMYTPSPRVDHSLTRKTESSDGLAVVTLQKLQSLIALQKATSLLRLQRALYNLRLS